ncbi:MAG: PAS domain S-box protein [Methanomicrobiaceae archaeon]|nr:PAS domain S-box protein [Methanomicrobiaceae archaeon]
MIKILYVDDERILLDLAKIFIEKKGDFTVDTAESAADALEMMKTETYDAIISDYQMPGMDGIEFLKVIRGSGDLTPFMIFTGRGREEIVIQAFENGADFYIQKGGDPNSQFVELLHKVKQAINLRQTGIALRESEEKYRLLVEKANEAILISQDKLVRFSNPRFSSILGIPMEQLIGTPISEIVHPDDHELVLGRYDQRLSGEDVTENYEFRILDSSGNTHWVKIHTTRILWEDKPALLILLDEITARKAAEEELHASNKKLVELNEELKGHLKTIADRNDELQGAYKQLKAAEEELRSNYEELEKKETILRETGEKFRRIVETAEEGIWEMDEETKTTFVNRKMADMLGYPVEEMLGKEISSFISKDEYPDHESLIKRRKKGQNDNYLRHFIRKDGEVRLMKVKATSLVDETRKFKGSFAMVSDITEQKQAEDALNESTQQLMDIIDFLPDATLVIDTGGKVIAWNRAIEKMTGVKAEDIIGKGNYEYSIPFYRERRPILVDLVLNSDPDNISKYPFVKREGNALLSEITIPHFNGGKGAHLWFISTPLYNIEGQITGAIESIRDITSKKEAEEELRTKNEELNAAYEQLAAVDEEIRQSFDELEKSHRDLENSEEKYRDLVENAPIGIFTSTSEGYYISINETGAKILGYSSPGEVIRSIRNLKNDLYFDPKRRDFFIDILDKKGSVEDFIIEIILPGREERRHLSINARVSERFSAGSFIIQGFFNDTTDLKNAHKALENANHQLKLLTGITRHDILNSVMAAYCYIDLLKSPEDPDREQYLKTLHEILQKIQRQIEFTREFENLGSHAPVWQNLSCILHDLEGQSPLPFHISDCDIEVFADPVLKKVFDTLLDNTIRHGGPGASRIDIKCGNSGGSDYSVVWQDDGSGIPYVDKDRIFERGYGRNTGLGLFLVREILGISGIKIRETGNPGEGARFEILIPPERYRMNSA